MTDKLAKLQELMKLANDGLTRQEFELAFKSLIDFIKRTDTNLSDKITAKSEDLDSKFAELDSIYRQTLSQLEQDNKSSMSNIKKWALEKVGQLFVNSKIDEKINELEQALKKAEELELPDADELAIETTARAISELKPLIPKEVVLEKEIPEMGEPIRDALEKLTDDDRLKIEAIKDLREELDDLKKFKKSYGGGGVRNFLALDDTPNVYTGQGGKAVYVNPGETGLQFQTAVSSDEKAKVSADDTTSGYLEDKLVAGTGITLTVNNPAGNETITIDASTGGIYNERFTTDGLTDTYTLSQTPVADSTAVYLNGVRMALDIDYTVSGNDIVFVSIPAAGAYTDNLTVDYNVSIAAIVPAVSGSGVTDLFTGNGVDDTFTLSQTLVAGTAKVYVNGARLRITDDYTEVGNTIVLVTVPQNNANIQVDYNVTNSSVVIPNSPRPLVSVAGVDLTSAAATLLYTVPAGKTFIYTMLIVTITDDNIVSGDATVSLGSNNPDYNNIFTATILNAATISNQSAYYYPPTGGGGVNVSTISAGDSVYFNVTIGGTAITWTGTITLLGFLI